MKSKLTSIALYALFLFGGIYLGIEFSSRLNLSSDKNLYINKVNDVLNYTGNFYVDDVDLNKLSEKAIERIFKELDPHTAYISKQDQSESEALFRGNFDGIGIEFQIIKDSITVVSPISGGPSESVGILSGDRIIKIEGKSCVGYSNQQVLTKLRGKKGTTVNLTIYRPSAKKEYDYKIVRARINLYSVDASFMFDKETGYIILTRFSDSTMEELEKSLQELTSRGMKNLILDLRNNPGGLLDQAVFVSDLFLDKNKLIVSTKGRRKEFNEQFVAEQKYPYENIPLIVLVNRGSASASEIVSGAIQDWDRGLIVGETTFGKGLVQRQMLLEDGSAIRLTVSKYLTPSGREIQRTYKNKEMYYDELINREEVEEDNLDHHTEADTAKPKFKTKFGRTVLGGGGITPDYIISSGTITNYSIALNRNNLLYRFVREFIDNGNFNKGKFTNVDEFINDFSISEKELNSFIAFAEKNSVKLNKTEFETDKKYISNRIKAFFARELFKDEGWYKVSLEDDKVFQKALTLKDEAKKIPGFNK
jgi:carboxyl-terminal processing protease